ncbi:MAG: PAS domain S-box protein [Gammaproteobacteria bacterium]|nr:PAS domain S-box protein [Gammaproteobacteria bacterium]
MSLPPSSNDHSANCEMYRNAFDKSPAPTIITRLNDGLILNVNPAFERWTGNSRDNLVGRSTSQDLVWLRPVDREKFITSIKSHVGSYSEERWLDIPQQGMRLCRSSAQLFTLGGEETIISLFQDITDEHQQQQSIQHNEAHLQVLADFEDLLFLQTDPDKVLNLIVEFLLDRMSADRAWLIAPSGASSEKVEVPYEAHQPDFPGAESRARPFADNKDFLLLRSRLLAKNDPVSYGPNQDYEVSAVMEELSQIQSQLAIAVRPATGEPWLFGLHQCSHPRDWTHAEKRLLKSIALRTTDRLNTLLLLRDKQQSEAQFRQLFESAPEGIVIFNIRSGKIENFNRAMVEMMGYENDQLTGMTVLDISPEQQPGGSSTELVDKLAIQALAGQSPRFEWVYRTKDGAEVIAEIQLQKLAGSDERLRVTAIDITDRRRLEEQLRQAQKMESVGELAGGIAHDFNNLLQGILGFSDLLIENPDVEEVHRKQLRHIHEAAARAATLTRQLLAFGRRQVLDKQDVSLNDLIDHNREMIERLIGTHIEFDFIPGHSLGTVHIDPVQLEQVLLNLYLNARDAMTDGGVLTIETENILITGEYCRTHRWASPGRYVMISVSDNGSGMNKETLGQIFEPFFSTKAAGGSGLGLSMAYGIVQQHGGMIQAYSEPGSGTTFKIYFPQTERPATTVGNKLSGRIQGGNETLLIAEDDPTILELAKTVLEESGYQVLTATNGREAVDLYQAQGSRIDLVLLDVIMPQLGGKQAFEMIYKLNPEVRCLFCSGYSTNGIHTDFVLRQGLQLLQKPFTPSDLLRNVRQILDKSA